MYAFGAVTLAIAETSGDIDFKITQHKGTEFQLETRQVPLARALDAISKQIKVAIHYSVLPEGVITATCVSASIKPLLECLLNKKADLIVRYQQNNGNVNKPEEIAEAWVLGSRLDGASNSASVYPEVSTKTTELGKKEQDEAVKANKVEKVLERTQSPDAEERVSAIGDLLAVGRKGDAKIKAVLENNLHDSDPNVRAQAVSTLSHLEDEEALPAIREALLDESVDVRMMAVDGITEDVALLQQAINDEDETVRSLAEIKLEQLTKAESQVETND